jgi:hypothetical protein
VRVRPSVCSSAVEGRAALGPGGVGRVEGHFAITVIASQRFKDAMRQPREAAIKRQVTNFPINRSRFKRE